jgi:predicted DNA-binding protein
MQTIKRRKTKFAVKRAISLPSDVDEQIATLSRAEGKSYSSMVCQAISFYLKRCEDLEMEMAYRAAYEDPETVAASETLAAELSAISSPTLEQPEGSKDDPNKRRGRLG